VNIPGISKTRERGPSCANSAIGSTRTAATDACLCCRLFIARKASSPVVSFSYIQPPEANLTEFTRHLNQYLPLFRSLSAFRFLYLARSSSHFQKARELFDSVVMIPLESSPVADLLRYFAVRKALGPSAVRFGFGSRPYLPQTIERTVFGTAFRIPLQGMESRACHGRPRAAGIPRKQRKPPRRVLGGTPRSGRNEWCDRRGTVMARENCIAHFVLREVFYLLGPRRTLSLRTSARPRREKQPPEKPLNPAPFGAVSRS